MIETPYRITSLQAYEEAWESSLQDPAGFWAEVASHFVWKNRWHTPMNADFGTHTIEWFPGATLNITENCLDRHLAARGEQVALIWEPNNPTEQPVSYTYNGLFEAVCRMAALLRHLGIRKGDRVCLYMGMVPDLAIAVLACARIGAIHSVIFGGFSARSVAERIQDAGAIAVITCDGAWRGSKEIPLKPVVDEALKSCPNVSIVLVSQRTGTAVHMQAGRDHWLQQALENIDLTSACLAPAEVLHAEDPLFILYTSGSTGKPKGVVHAGGGYMVYAAYSFVNVFQPIPGDVHFCTADIGWITGHTYLLYAPLLTGITTIMFEGVPTWPDAGRFWDIVQKHRVNIFYTAPTAIRSLMAFGTGPLVGKDVSSLRVLGTVGEPINEEAWHWYFNEVGKGKCEIVDTWWQTETGGILISNLAGITPSKPAHATLPLPGVHPMLVDEHGKEVHGNDAGGNLCIRQAWPSAIRTTWGDHDRFKKTYFSTYPGMYFTGDGALRDDTGNYRITGRVDDVLNVSGHRLGTAEIENALNAHPQIIESAVVGFPHSIKGQGIYAYVVPAGSIDDHHQLETDLLQTVSEMIGPIARPDKIQIVAGLPKTRSGKIMRRILRKIAEGEIENLGDTSTLLDPGIVQQIITERK